MPRDGRSSGFSGTGAPAGLSDLAARTVTSVLEAAASSSSSSSSASGGAPSAASRLGVTCTGLLAIYWLLQVAQTIAWPLCLFLLGMVAFAPGFMSALLKEMAPSSLQRFCRSVGHLSRSFSSIPSCDRSVLMQAVGPCPLTPTPMHTLTLTASHERRMAEAAALLADSYLLLPQHFDLPGAVVPGQPGPSGVSPVHVLNTAPMHYCFMPMRSDSAPRPNPKRPEQSSLPTRADMEEIVEEEVVEERPCAAMFDSGGPSTSANGPLRATVSETESTRSTVAELRHFDRPKTSPARPSGTSITLSNFCIPPMNSSRLVMFTTTAQLLSAPCAQVNRSPSGHALAQSDSEEPIAGFFAPATDSFFLIARPPPGGGAEAPSSAASDADLASAERLSVCLRLPSEEELSALNVTAQSDGAQPRSGLVPPPPWQSSGFSLDERAIRVAAEEALRAGSFTTMEGSASAPCQMAPASAKKRK